MKDCNLGTPRAAEDDDLLSYEQVITFSLLDLYVLSNPLNLLLVAAGARANGHAEDTTKRFP
jgi:hypothetical protein